MSSGDRSARACAFNERDSQPNQNGMQFGSDRSAGLQCGKLCQAITQPDIGWRVLAIPVTSSYTCCMNFWIFPSNPDIFAIDTLDRSAHQTARRRGITFHVAKASQRRSSLTRQNEAAAKLRERRDGSHIELEYVPARSSTNTAQLAICNHYSSSKELTRWKFVTKWLMFFQEGKPRVLKLRLKTRGGSECMSQ